MLEPNRNSTATVPEQPEAKPSLRRSTPVVITLVAILGLIGIANISSLMSGSKKSAPASALTIRPATANPQQVAESCRSRHPESALHGWPRKPSRLGAPHRALQTVSSSTPGADAPRPVRRSSMDGERRTLPHPRPKCLRRPAHALCRLALQERRAFVAIAFARELVLLSLEQRSLALATEWHNRSRFTTNRQRRATAGAR